MATAPINAKMADPGVESYYDDGFIAVLEDHMTYLRSAASGTTELQIDAQAALKYQGDFYGLITAVNNTPYRLHRVVLRMNNFASPDESPANLRSILIPDPRAVDVIRQAYSAQMKSSV